MSDRSVFRGSSNLLMREGFDDLSMLLRMMYTQGKQGSREKLKRLLSWVAFLGSGLLGGLLVRQWGHPTASFDTQGSRLTRQLLQHKWAAWAVVARSVVSFTCLSHGAKASSCV